MNGTAELSLDDELRAPSRERGRPPKRVIRVGVEAACLHCARALRRADLWLREARVPRDTLSTMNHRIRDQLGDESPP